MPRAIVSKGDETWELREVPKPELRPGCAVLRVEAVGTCPSDVDQFRIEDEAAAELGVQETEDAAAVVAEATGGLMADVVLDVASGHPASFITAFELVRRGGTVVAAGMKTRALDGFDINQIPLRNIAVLPGGGVNLALAYTLINDGKVPTMELLGESFPLEQFEDALALAERRVEGKDAVRVSLEVSP